MEKAKLYDDLAKHLDQGIMGAPKSEALMGILEVLFPVEEAEVALRLPMQNQTLSELKKAFPERPDIEGILDRMAQRGTVFTSQKPGEERKYRLLPSVVGWAETPFWPGRETEDTRKLAPLWIRYRDEAFARELARAETPVVRVIPVSKTLENPSQVLPFDALKPVVEAQSFCAVAHCPCRQMTASVGDGCEHSLENCLHFGSMARYMVEQGMARRITPQETLSILQAATAEGLVHVADNIQGHLATICNCCGCCCVFLDTKKRTGLHTFSPSNYVARVDAAACVGCGNCEERCPMEAVQVGKDGAARVDPSRCIGCGVCTPTCSGDAVDLVLRGEVKPPPQIQEFLAARWKRP